MKMVPVLFAALRESFGVGVVGGGVEYPGVRPVARDALALEVGHMPRQRHRTEFGAAVANDRTMTRPAGGGTGGQGIRRPPPRPKLERPGCRLLEGPAAVARFLRGPHHLGDEALRSLAARLP